MGDIGVISYRGYLLHQRGEGQVGIYRDGHWIQWVDGDFDDAKKTVDDWLYAR